MSKFDLDGTQIFNTDTGKTIIDLADINETDLVKKTLKEIIEDLLENQENLQLTIDCLVNENDDLRVEIDNEKNEYWEQDYE